MLSDEPLAYEVVASRSVFDGHIWQVRRERIDHPGGVIERDFVRHPGSVAVIAVDDQERVLLIRQYRHPVGERLWELPAGLVDQTDASLAAAAARELHEETGYLAGELREFTRLYPSPGGSDESVTIFLATELRHQPHGVALAGEEALLEMRWAPLTEAAEAVMAGRLKNGIAMAAILQLALARRSGR